MDVKLKRRTFSGASQLHLVFPGATGHVPSTVLTSLAQTGDVIYLEGAYPEIGSSDDAEQADTVTRILRSIAEIIPSGAKITHTHIYCAGMLPASVVIPALQKEGLLTMDTDSSIVCYDPPFYVMPADTIVELCAKVFESFMLGIKALFLEKGLSPDLPFTVFSDIDSSPTNITEFILALQTSCGLLFASHSAAGTLASHYCHNLLMQTRTPPTKKGICDLRSFTSQSVVCHFSGDAAAQKEEILELQKTGSDAIRISTHPHCTHAALMNVTSATLTDEDATDRMSTETGRPMVVGTTPPRPGSNYSGGRHSPPRPPGGKMTGGYGAFYPSFSLGLGSMATAVPTTTFNIKPFNGSTAAKGGVDERAGLSSPPGDSATSASETASIVSRTSSIGYR